MPTLIINRVGLEQIFFVIFLGWCLGVVVNYFSDVLPIWKTFRQPTCFSCTEKIGFLDYFLLKKCRCCGTRRFLRTWFVQGLIIVILILMLFFPLRRLEYWIGAILLVYFAIVVVIDLEYHLILHRVSAVGAIGGFLLGWHLNGLESTIIGGLAGSGIMFLLYLLGILFLRLFGDARARQEDVSALGFGDVTLGGVIGLMLGWMDIVGGLLIAIISGGIISGIFILVTWLARRYKPLIGIPYGPFLVIGALFYLFVPSFYYI